MLLINNYFSECTIYCLDFCQDYACDIKKHYASFELFSKSSLLPDPLLLCGGKIVTF